VQEERNIFLDISRAIDQHRQDNQQIPLIPRSNNLSAVEAMMIGYPELFNRQPLQRAVPISQEQKDEIERRRLHLQEEHRLAEERLREIRERNARANDEFQRRVQESNVRLQALSDQNDRSLEAIRQAVEQKKKKIEETRQERLERIKSNIQAKRAVPKRNSYIPVGSLLERYVLSLPQEKRKECQELHQLTVVVLKEMCRERREKVGGNKLELIARLLGHPIPKEAGPAGAPEQSSQSPQ
jgi:hypothetical protein